MVHLHTAWEIPPPPTSLHAPVLPFQRMAAVSKTMKEERVQEYLHQEYKIRSQQAIFSPTYTGQVLTHIYTYTYTHTRTRTKDSGRREDLQHNLHPYNCKSTDHLDIVRNY